MIFPNTTQEMIWCERVFHWTELFALGRRERGGKKRRRRLWVGKE